MSATRHLFTACACAAVLILTSGAGTAQTYGLASMQPGSVNHTTSSAIAKVLKEKGGLNTLVQPTAGETVIIAIVGRGEADFGMANAPEIGTAITSNEQPNLRMIGAVYTLKTGFWVRKDSNMRTVADLRGKRVTMGYSAMRALDPLSRAILATGGLTEKDIKPVLVPNVVRSADDFVAGAADMFMFAFGAPKVREVDVSVGGTRFLEIPESPGMAEARKIQPYGYLSDAAPGPIFIGVEKPMKVYTIDNLLFTHAKVPDDVVYKVIATMEANKDDMIAVAPNLREFSAAGLHKQYDFPYHPGAAKYFKERKIEAKAIQ
ncbi:MAG TPA: TAXI family TRAP transporter solute-binding subunit [Xanthobacteraceae bacterium]|nr:TAXI family TRAP transporter solute-binding subunit [Xanthobacteraceae bacterium]